MNKKSLILTVLLVLIVFLATNAISAEDTSNIDNNASEILEVFEDNNIAAGKEVTIETGFVVKVPMFVEQGDKIVVTTFDGKYSSKG